MSGKIVSATNLDSVRIEVLGEGRAVTVPAGLILAADRVLRKLALQDEALSIDPVEDDRTGWRGFEATFDSDNGNVVIGHGESPWGALVALADKLES